ncbi:ABC transporter substrate-binding protein [Herbiconiux sp. CPCC 203407]|uniref:ABC transporter substrate-binding protein n=1 Tax=Herbiconiux oxytropis TaxID=2970915 RepID=A0AA42BV89_9MICO|nr:ABC transporter substrate-binding protein [Herbiconiux oxytropis]MCS5724086.1 ABC transporter substrate-binding protein [Herbiconiux oxytropis]MCS5726981.1 ABC transporter substrate-binding protein [Herbiconiux oxytropis]
MNLPRRLLAAGAVLGAAALLVSACTGPVSADPGAAPKAETGEAAYGGTLKVGAIQDFNALDTQLAYWTEDWQVVRLLSRQLVTYPGSTEGIGEDTTVVPDLAESWDVSDDGLVYTFHLRDGIRYSGASDREIVADDFIYAIKRFPDPNNQVSAITYYNALLEGFVEYREKFEAEVPVGDVGAVKEFIDSNEISGLTAVDDKTLQITLTQPANDFLDVLTLNFVSPLPEEVVSQYFPDSLEYRQNYVSSGPYEIESYEPNQSIAITKVDGYDNEGDPRPAYIDRFEIDFSYSTADAVSQAIQTGTVDIGFYVSPYPAHVIQSYQDTQPENLHISPSGSQTFISINNPDESEPLTEGQEALKDLRVREALQYAINKADIVRGRGGEVSAQARSEILTSTLLGYNDIDYFATEGDEGDPEKARELLKEAGYPDLSLKLAYRVSPENEAIFTSVQSSVARAGITIDLVPIPAADYAASLEDPAKRGQWDIAQGGYSPDWQGNGSRMIVGGWLNSEFNPGYVWNGVNYHSDALNAEVEKAFAAPTAEAAEPFWQEANRIASEDVAWIPLFETIRVFPSSDRVANWTWQSLGNGPDWASLQVVD